MKQSLRLLLLGLLLAASPDAAGQLPTVVTEVAAPVPETTVFSPSLRFEGKVIEHQADTSGGQSGSGFYHYADPSCSGCGYGPYLVAIHRAGSTNYNLARRFDSTVYSFLQAYSSDY